MVLLIIIMWLRAQGIMLELVRCIVSIKIRVALLA